MTDLNRFDAAQASIYPTALSELQSGRKATHWIWFIFPQLKALGRSATALHYGISDIDEARAYLADPVLGPRLRACMEAMLAHEGTPPETILGSTDALKLRSCATLFEAAGGGALFASVLDAFYDGVRCDRTLTLLRG